LRPVLYIYIYVCLQYVDTARKFDSSRNLNFKYKTEFEEVADDALRNTSPCKQIDLLFYIL